MSEPMFLIWSNQHAQWWRPNKRGYTQWIEEAGRYPQAVAQALVEDATLGGSLRYQRADPVTDRPYEAVDEWMVLAPECTPAIDAAHDLKPAVPSWEAAMSPQAVADAEAEEAARDAEDQQGWGGPDPKEKR